MAIVCIITGVLQLLTLVTVTGILITFAALFHLLELALLAANPVCFYLIRQTGVLLTYSIGLSIWKIQDISIKLCPGLENQSVQNNSIVGTIEPLPLDMNLNSEERLQSEINLNDVVNDSTNSNENPEIPENSNETLEDSKILNKTPENPDGISQKTNEITEENSEIASV